MTDNHGIVYELFVIVDLKTYCMNSNRNGLYKMTHICMYSITPLLQLQPQWL